MKLTEIKIGGCYKLDAVVVTREGDSSCTELLVKVTAVKHDKGLVEVCFPPLSESRWTTPNNLYPLG